MSYLIQSTESWLEGLEYWERREMRKKGKMRRVKLSKFLCLREDRVLRVAEWAKAHGRNNVVYAASLSEALVDLGLRFPVPQNMFGISRIVPELIEDHIGVFDMPVLPEFPDIEEDEVHDAFIETVNKMGGRIYFLDNANDGDPTGNSDKLAFIASKLILTTSLASIKRQISATDSKKDDKQIRLSGQAWRCLSASMRREFVGASGFGRLIRNITWRHCHPRVYETMAHVEAYLEVFSEPHLHGQKWFLTFLSQYAPIFERVLNGGSAPNGEEALYAWILAQYGWFKNVGGLEGALKAAQKGCTDDTGGTPEAGDDSSVDESGM